MINESSNFVFFLSSLHYNDFVTSVLIVIPTVSSINIRSVVSVLGISRVVNLIINIQGSDLRV